MSSYSFLSVICIVVFPVCTVLGYILDTIFHRGKKKRDDLDVLRVYCGTYGLLINSLSNGDLMQHAIGDITGIKLFQVSDVERFTCDSRKLLLLESSFAAIEMRPSFLPPSTVRAPARDRLADEHRKNTNKPGRKYTLWQYWI
uniref:Uncharacterized protein n=1 Tax=Rhodnius prolixus TaxID=13249 RepID=T1HNN4_RHOPR